MPESGNHYPRGIIRKLTVMAAVVLLASCGAGAGTERILPAGPPTSAAPSDDVLYVAFSQSHQVAAFRLGVDGFLPATPFSTMTVDSPREMIRSGDFLYVGTDDRVVSARIAPDGSLPSQPDAESSRIEGGDVTDLLVIDDVLYATFGDAEVLISYRLESGQIPSEILTVSAEAFSDYISMAEADGYIYTHAASLARIDTFRIRPEGGLDEVPELRLPEIDLFGCEQLRIRDGIIYAGESLRERINTYTIDSVGLPQGLEDGEDPISHTEAEERYVDFVLDGDFLHALAFNKGRIDTYEIDPVDGTLPEQGPIGVTEHDTGLFPAALLVLDGFLYVAQGGRDRIDGYTISGDGTLSPFPVTSTLPISPGFPNSIAHGIYPP